MRAIFLSSVDAGRRLLTGISLFSLVAGTAAVGAAGCASIAREFQRPDLNLVSVRLVDAALFEQRFALVVDVRNPNDFDLPVKGLQYTLALAGEKFAGGVTPQSFIVPAFGEARFETLVSTNLVSTIRHLSEWMEGSPRQIDYELEGKLKIDLPFVRSIPFSESGYVDLNK